MSEIMFPIMGGTNIPWDMIAPHEDQAKRNHRQTLKRLAERGGLDCTEAVDVLTGQTFGTTFRTKGVEQANKELAQIVQKYNELKEKK